MLCNLNIQVSGGCFISCHNASSKKNILNSFWVAFHLYNGADTDYVGSGSSSSDESGISNHASVTTPTAAGAYFKFSDYLDAVTSSAATD
jgi:hypothetical protein